MQSISPVSILIVPAAGSMSMQQLLASDRNVVPREGFLMAQQEPAWKSDDAMRPHPFWRTYESSLLHPAVQEAKARSDSGMNPIEEAHWNAVVDQLVQAGMAVRSDEAVKLMAAVRVRSRGVRSLPIYDIDSLKSYVLLYTRSPMPAGVAIEPVDYDSLSVRVRSLSAAMSEGRATEADRELHDRLVRIMIGRVSDHIDSMIRGAQ